MSIFTVAVLLAGCASAAGTPPRDRFLKGYHTHRGRIIDAETKEPLVGAAVVAVWEQEERWLLQTSDVFYEAREVLTDANGNFVLDAEELERNAPARTLPPFFTIFFPGYGSFPSYQVAPKGFLRGIFEGAGVTVELPKLKTREERLQVIGRMPPAVPDQSIPNLLRMMNLEEISLGLQPTHLPKGKRRWGDSARVFKLGSYFPR
jgi:hypothetical protein